MSPVLRTAFESTWQTVKAHPLLIYGAIVGIGTLIYIVPSSHSRFGFSLVGLVDFLSNFLTSSILFSPPRCSWALTWSPTIRSILGDHAG